MHVKFSIMKTDYSKEPIGYAPTQGTPGSAGWDLRACETVIVPQGRKVRVRTGIKVAIPAGHVGDVRSRSGIAFKHDVFVLNSPGTIDSDYRGEMHVMLMNLGQADFTVCNGDRIAQLVVLPVPSVEFVEIPEAEMDDDVTLRGAGGYGSTGR